MKRSWILVFCAAFFLNCGAALAADTPPAEQPQIVVCAGAIALATETGLNVWNGAEYDRMDTFQILAQQKGEWPRIPLGTNITMKIEGAQPDAYRLIDYVITEDGEYKYHSDVEPEPIALSYDGEAYHFDLPENWTVGFSSNSEDYEPGRTIRGFRFECSWGENACEYAFILRTDAFPISAPDDIIE